VSYSVCHTACVIQHFPRVCASPSLLALHTVACVSFASCCFPPGHVLCVGALCGGGCVRRGHAVRAARGRRVARSARHRKQPRAAAPAIANPAAIIAAAAGAPRSGGSGGAAAGGLAGGGRAGRRVAGESQGDSGPKRAVARGRGGVVARGRHMGAAVQSAGAKPVERVLSYRCTMGCTASLGPRRCAALYYSASCGPCWRPCRGGPSCACHASRAC
jgi:hypothetical protein